jgi:hypothetical protein
LIVPRAGFRLFAPYFFVQAEVKYKLKKVVIPFLSVIAVLALTLVVVSSSILAHGAGSLTVGLSSNPRFPIVGQQAELTFTPVYSDGTPNTGLAPMVMVAWTASGGHTDGPAPATAANATPAGGSMAGMDMGGTPATAGTPPDIMLMPVETSPGVYAANITFEQGGRYVATFSSGDEEADVVVGVRSSPVSWGYVGMLAGLIIILAVSVAVVKTVRRTW